MLKKPNHNAIFWCEKISEESSQDALDESQESSRLRFGASFAWRGILGSGLVEFRAEGLRVQGVGFWGLGLRVLGFRA